MNTTLQEKDAVRETLPHEELEEAIRHLEESALEALIQLRQEICGECEASSEAEKSAYNATSLESVLKKSPQQIHRLNNLLYEEIGTIRNALFQRN